MSSREVKERGAAPQQVRLEERIYQELLSRIHRGSYALGQKLPSEIDFTEEFKVSRPVVRSALARLRDAGLIVSRQGAGSFVGSGETNSGGGFSALSSIETISSYFKYRRIIECEAAASAAKEPNKKLLNEMGELIRLMDGEIEAGLTTVEQDIRFHGIIAQMSGNRFLVESLQMLRPHTLFLGRFVRSLSPSGYIRGKIDMNNEHLEIINAIKSGDPELARETIGNHIDGSVDRIFKGE